MIKESNENTLAPKAQLVLNGHRHKDRFSVRRDSLSADLSTVQMVLSIAMVLKMEITTADVRGAYMQLGPTQRAIYSQLPKYICSGQNMIWKLQKLSYGVVKAGRQCLCATGSWLISIRKVHCLTGGDQHSVKTGDNVKIVLLTTAVSDNFGGKKRRSCKRIPASKQHALSAG